MTEPTPTWPPPTGPTPPTPPTAPTPAAPTPSTGPTPPTADQPSAYPTAPYQYQYPYPGYAGYPPPPPPRRRTGLFIGIGAGAFVVVAAIVVGAIVLLNGVLLTRAPEATAGAPTPTGSGSAVDLAGILLEPPSGTTKADGFGSSDGTVSLSDLADLYDNESAWTDTLETLQYTTGASVAWLTDDDTLVQIGVFHFALQRSSVAFFADNAYAYTHPPDIYTQKRLDAIPSGNYYLLAKPDDDGFVDANAWFFKGNIAAWIMVLRKGSIDEAALLKLAQDQYARLP